MEIKPKFTTIHQGGEQLFFRGIRISKKGDPHSRGNEDTNQSRYERYKHKFPEHHHPLHQRTTKRRHTQRGTDEGRGRDIRHTSTSKQQKLQKQTKTTT